MNQETITRHAKRIVKDYIACLPEDWVDDDEKLGDCSDDVLDDILEEADSILEWLSQKLKGKE